jgi:hypothetical protein
MEVAFLRAKSLSRVCRLRTLNQRSRPAYAQSCGSAGQPTHKATARQDTPNVFARPGRDGDQDGQAE